MMTSETILSIDLENKVIEYGDGQSKQLLGSTIMYIVQ